MRALIYYLMLNVLRTELLAELVTLLRAPDASLVQRYLTARSSQITPYCVDFLFLELCQRLESDAAYEAPLRVVLRLYKQ